MWARSRFLTQNKRRKFSLLLVKKPDDFGVWGKGQKHFSLTRESFWRAKIRIAWKLYALIAQLYKARRGGRHLGSIYPHGKFSISKQEISQKLFLKKSHSYFLFKIKDMKTNPTLIWTNNVAYYRGKIRSDFCKK